VAEKKTFRFFACIEPLDIGLVQHCIVVPPEILDQLKRRGRIRIKGKMNKVPIALAIQSKKNGVRYLSVSRDLKKKINVASDEKIQVQFQLADLEELDMPEEMSALLEQDEEAMTLWNTFTTGAKRGLLHYISSGKSVETRIKRSIEIMNKGKMGLLQMQKKS
jgi:uncharacterized protein YdeI (YjbR/CyaY-like superfamily)